MDECKPLADGLHRRAAPCQRHVYHHRPARRPPCRPVQVDPIKPKWKMPRTDRLNLMCDILLLTSAFKFNLRRYILGGVGGVGRAGGPLGGSGGSFGFAGGEQRGGGKTPARHSIESDASDTAWGRGSHSLPSKRNLRTFGNTSFPLELNLSTFGPRPLLDLDYMGDQVSLS